MRCTPRIVHYAVGLPNPIRLASCEDGSSQLIGVIWRFGPTSLPGAYLVPCKPIEIPTGGVVRYGTLEALGSHPCATRENPLRPDLRRPSSLWHFAPNDGVHICSGCGLHLSHPLPLGSTLVSGIPSLLPTLAQVSSLVRGICPPWGLVVPLRFEPRPHIMLDHCY